jgi:dUTP pyrophosphatase
VERFEVKVEILKNGKGLQLPCYQTNGASGIDLYAANTESIILKKKESALIPTGLKMEIPDGYELQIRPRSGLALKEQISILNSPGTVDSDYRGEIKIILINLSNKDFTIKRGMRIAQGIFQKVERANFIIVNKVNETKRGKGGFGHTGN